MAWLDPRGEQNSVRLFLVNDGVAFEDVDAPDLVGIIQRQGDKIAEQDPFGVIQQMDAGAKRRWGSGFQKTYVGAKIKQLPRNLPHAINGDELLLKRVELSGKQFYAVAATWYGEESSLVIVSLD